MQGKSGKKHKKSGERPMGTIRMEEESAFEEYEPADAGQMDLAAQVGSIRCEMVRESEDRMELEFDLIGIRAPFANALRRILLAEVPSIAIEKVYLYQNTSVIPDEVLCHRFGLLPVAANADDFDFPTGPTLGMLSDEEKEQLNDNIEEEPAGDPAINLVFEIKAKCSKKDGAPSHVPKEEWEQHYEHATVLSSAMRWCPIGEQATKYQKYSETPAMVNGEIIVAKMRPGMEIEARCHCVKGVGRDHAKFSPVATAFYRLKPVLKMKREVAGEAAQRLKDAFSPGVIGIDKKTKVAYIADERADTSSRNIYRHADLCDAVEMSKLKEHFIFTIESVGAVRAQKLFVDAVHLMHEKIDSTRDAVERMLAEL